jgi:hypothetical protein
MYNYLASYWSWYWSNKTEILSPTNAPTNTLFQTASSIGRIFSIKDANDSELYPVNISPDMIYDKPVDEPDAWYVRWDTSETFKTVSTQDSVTIVYSRMPKWHSIDNKSEQFDCPPECFIGVLLLTNWLMFPIHLEQWASLANNYYNQATTFLDQYAKNLNPANTRFTA